MGETTEQPLKILLLGGTSEAARLAAHLATMRNVAAILSLAGRTQKPAPSALPVRSGGFGGIEGLASYLLREAVHVVIDATHPFAAQISNNAVAACRTANVPLLAIERPAWERTSGDDWREHATVEDAIAALPDTPCVVFSALGRSAVPLLCAKPQHRYVIRTVDPIIPSSELASATIIAARGPFCADDDIALFQKYGIACVLAKNSGGDAAHAKIEAARRMRLPVHIVQRPVIAARPVATTCEDALAWIAHHRSSRTKRGV